jgi:RNA polymerase sigma-70 factor (ECF subfamily)
MKRNRIQGFVTQTLVPTYNNTSIMTAFEFETSLTKAESKLYPAAMQLTQDPEETKDLLQLTFMKAWINKHSFNTGTNFNAWLFIIMKNSFISSYHKNKRRKTYTDESVNQYLINSIQTVDTRQADSEINVRDITDIIEDLPTRYKSPFQLYVDGYKYHEICDRLSLPLGTVKNRIFLARQKLKTKLVNQDLASIS